MTPLQAIAPLLWFGVLMIWAALLLRCSGNVPEGSDITPLHRADCCVVPEAAMRKLQKSAPVGSDMPTAFGGRQ